MKEILAHSASLSLIYIENDTPIDLKVHETLKSFFNDVTVSKEINEYIHDYEVLHAFPDIIMIELRGNNETCSIDIGKIRKLNPDQMIVAISEEYSKKQLLTLSRAKIYYFLTKPLKHDELYTVCFEASKDVYAANLTKENTKMLQQKVSDLDQTIQAIEYARETKDQFFANVSHEIRTPINAVIGLSHILLDTNIETKYLDYVSKIKTSGNLILSIVNDILDFSKIEAGKLAIEVIEFDINTVLDSVSTMVDFKANEKNLDLIFDIGDNVPTKIKGDPLRLSQILINLITNAVKFTHEGEIVLSAQLLPAVDGKQTIEFCVSDTGIGIKEDYIPNLFQTFTQADSSTTRNYGGTGLGLTISKQLVELMGGEISVTSEYGKGSKFIFTIEAESIETGKYTLSSKKLKDKKVLIIDKSIKTKESLGRILHYFGYTTLETSTTEGLIEHIEKEDFDILFLDETLAKECKSKITKKESRAKIVLMHHGYDIDNVNSFNNIDIDADLNKPFNQKMLFTTILKLFDEKSVPDVSNDTHINKKSLKPISGAHILLAEDNKINQSLLVALLENTNIKITIANNGQEVLNLLDEINDVDLILMDIEMPIMDGYETVQHLRKNALYQSIPIIALSGNTTQADIDKVKSAGMNDHLAKPMDVNIFYKFLLQYISPKLDLGQRLVKSAEEFQSLAGIGHYQEIIELATLIRKETERLNLPNLNTSLLAIIDNINKHEKVFLILIGNYKKAFQSFLNATDIFLNSSEISKKEMLEITKVLNIEESMALAKGDKDSYRVELEFFCDKYRDSTEVLEKRIKNLKLGEATQLSYQIKKEARDLGALSFSQSLEPIVAIEQTQRSQLNKAIIAFSKITKKDLEEIKK